MGLFSRGSQRQVGIDIGTSSIKAVELKQEGSHLALQNYGIIYGLDFLQHVAAGPTDRTTFITAENHSVAILKKLLSFSGISAKEAVFPIPIFSSFLTVVELPFMNMEELEQAISLQASSYIPVPLEEVVLDWLAIPPRPKKVRTPAVPLPLTAVPAREPQAVTVAYQSPGIGMRPDALPVAAGSEAQTVSVLLVAIPRETISYYEGIAHLAGLEIAAVESESFSMLRSLIGNDPGAIMLIDLGARSSTMTIVEQGFIHASHTVDLSGKELTDDIAKSLNIAQDRAEDLKKKQGLEAGPNAESIKQVLSPALEKLATEYKKMTDYYRTEADGVVEKVILTGGSSGLPGLSAYLQQRLGITVMRGNPFARVKHPEELTEILTRELSPHLSVAVGAAMRDLE